MNPEDQQEAPTGSASESGAAPQMETAEDHSGRGDVSHGANSNLTPATAQSGADVEAAEEIQRQHQGEGQT
ncbi:hypothetical protein Q0M94_04280 [Deinococcus radiomollis]|uniref:hypothetical protein n=1 Tax=Deinococcus radiomollis TaxID=468916 RepID=UPI0038914867